MENVLSNSDVWNNVTTSSSEDDAQTLHLAHIRYLTLKIVYIVIATVGVLDNLFVVIVFALFVKITDKVSTILKYYAKHLRQFHANLQRCKSSQEFYLSLK